MKKGILITIAIVIVIGLGVYLNNSTTNSKGNDSNIHSHNGGDLHSH